MNEREALKMALEALTNAYWPTESDLMPAHNIKECAEAITAIREALAQPEQEPVAWRGYNWGHSPDDWVYRDFDDPILDGNGNNVGQPLYTTPPQRKPLTDEQIEIVHRSTWMQSTATLHDFARAIEAAHGIKGEA